MRIWTAETLSLVAVLIIGSLLSKRKCVKTMRLGWHNLISMALIAGVLLVTTGCGRRGALEAPPSAGVVTTDEQGNVIKQSGEKPDKPFILDGLL